MDRNHFKNNDIDSNKDRHGFMADQIIKINKLTFQRKAEDEEEKEKSLEDESLQNNSGKENQTFISLLKYKKLKNEFKAKNPEKDINETNFSLQSSKRTSAISNLTSKLQRKSKLINLRNKRRSRVTKFLQSAKGSKRTSKANNRMSVLNPFNNKIGNH